MRSILCRSRRITTSNGTHSSLTNSNFTNSSTTISASTKIAQPEREAKTNRSCSIQTYTDYSVK